MKSVLFAALVSLLWAPVICHSADPDKLYALSHSALACWFEDDMNLALRSIERRDASMLSYLFKRGSCWPDESGLDVKITGVSRYNRLAVRVAPVCGQTPFWVSAPSIMGYIDNVLLPEIRSEGQR